MAKVTLKNLSKIFGDKKALVNFSLDIKEGEFLVFLGPSGCGKTTLLRLIAGLENPDSGEIYIGDQLVNKLMPKERDIAMVFQNYALYPHMTVFENLAFPLKVKKVSSPGINQNVNQIARLLNLTPILNKKPKQISGGEKQRVAVGRALVRNPRVFLLDEPFSNLDTQLRVQMRSELSRIQKFFKVTTLFVTHDQSEAMTLGDRIVILKDGQIQQIGTPAEVYQKPVNLFVASFMGSPAMNFISGKIGQPNLFHIRENLTFFLPEGKKFLQKFTGKEVILGLRAENIIPHTVQNRDQKNIVFCQVQAVENTGSDLYLYFKINNQSLISKSRLNLQLHSDEELAFEFDLGSSYFFDPETGFSLSQFSAR